jgi:hypothetical protein
MSAGIGSRNARPPAANRFPGRERVFKRDLIHVRTTNAAEPQHLLLGIRGGDVLAECVTNGCDNRVAKRQARARNSSNASRVSDLFIELKFWVGNVKD